MPYVSEELYQRLPKPNGGKNSPPSLCVTPYPQSSEVRIFFYSLIIIYFSSLNNIVMKKLKKMLKQFTMRLKKFVHIVQQIKLFQRKKILVSLLRSS
jgi:valyl-tRNA synthetase